MTWVVANTILALMIIVVKTALHTVSIYEYCTPIIGFSLADMFLPVFDHSCLAFTVWTVDFNEVQKVKTVTFRKHRKCIVLQTLNTVP